MLEEFIRRLDVDVAILKEVTTVHNITIKGYQVTDNVGTLGRGMAILHKDDLHIHTIRRLLSGRGIAAYYNNICFINLYAPSGTSKRIERVAFFNIDIINILPRTPTDLIMAGDFNCVQSDSDCAGHRHSSEHDPLQLIG